MRFPDSLVIYSTLLVALLLTALRLPADAPAVMGWLRPDWAALVLLYWVMAVPQQVGMGTAWVVGILVDSLTGNLLGQHALGLVLIAFLALSLYERLRMYSQLQQAVIVFVGIAVAQWLDFSIAAFTRGATWSPMMLLPALTSALIWPFAFALLRALRRRFNIA